MYRYLALDALVERDKSLGRHNSRNHLHLVVEQIHELFVVAGIQLEKHCVRTGGVVALNNLVYVLQLLYHVLVHAAAFEVQSYVGACAVAYAFGVDIESAAGYYANIAIISDLIDADRYSSFEKIEAAARKKALAYANQKNAAALAAFADDNEMKKAIKAVKGDTFER